MPSNGRASGGNQAGERAASPGNRACAPAEGWLPAGGAGEFPSLDRKRPEETPLLRPCPPGPLCSPTLPATPCSCGGKAARPASAKLRGPRGSGESRRAWPPPTARDEWAPREAPDRKGGACKARIRPPNPPCEAQPLNRPGRGGGRWRLGFQPPGRRCPPSITGWSCCSPPPVARPPSRVSLCSATYTASLSPKGSFAALWPWPAVATSVHGYVVGFLVLLLLHSPNEHTHTHSLTRQQSGRCRASPRAHQTLPSNRFLFSQMICIFFGCTERRVCLKESLRKQLGSLASGCGVPCVHLPLRRWYPA